MAVNSKAHPQARAAAIVAAQEPAEAARFIERQLLADRTDTLFAGTGMALVANPIAIGCLAAILWEVLPKSQVVAVLAIHAFVLLLRLLLLLGYRRAKRREAAPEYERWLRWYRVGIGAYGLAWGLAAAVYFSPEHLHYQLFLMLVLSGLFVGAIASLSIDYVSYGLYTTPWLMVMGFRLMHEGQSIHHVIAFMLVVFGLYMALAVRRFYLMVVDNLRQRLEVKLREESLSRYEFIVNAVTDLMSVIGRDRRYEAVSDSWCRLMARKREEVISRPVAEVWGRHAYAEQVQPMLAQCFAEGLAVSHQVMIEFPAIGARECLISYFPYKNAAAEVTHVVIVSRDITELEQARRNLLDAKTSAEQANRAKSEFLANMSHELRTPMNAIIGFAQLLDADEGLTADQRENLQEILKGGRHLLDLINDVLDLAKIESAHVEVSMEPVDLAELIDACRMLIRPLLEARQIEFSVDLPEGLWVRADRVRLKQVLINVLSNAVKYNRDGGSVRLDARPLADARLQVTVADTGKGIAPERMGELFKPFSRLEAEYSGIEGTGIGLTIAQRLITLMGGSIRVDSQVDVGTTVCIELQTAQPLQAPDAGDAGQGDESAVDAVDHAAAEPEARSSVLYIDDNVSNLTLVARILGRQARLDVVTAHEPQLGIDLARKQPPDLILLDITMPGLDGYQVLEVFKSDPRLRDVPVIALSANALTLDIARALQAGFVDYVTKPIDVEKFLQAVDRGLDLSEHQPDRGSGVR